MRILLLSFFIFWFTTSPASAQVTGCMDPQSSNYDPSATISDGSCIYSNNLVALKDFKKAALPSEISEISGMIYFDGKLYGHNDSGGRPALYEIDTTSGEITKTIFLENAVNVDWEDITQDSVYIYVGDFGNNISGNRTDLKIYRFPKEDIKKISTASGLIPANDIDIIHFKYEDQSDFSESGANATKYDCEAMICDNEKIHLFTKNWLGDYTVHYEISAIPTTEIQTAVRKDSMNTQGILITGAARINYETTALLGYEVKGNPAGFLWIISGYNDVENILSSGNKRKINLGKIVDGLNSGIGQVEGISVVNNDRVFISNENFSRKILGITVSVPQSFYGLSVSQWIPQYIAQSLDITGFSAKADGENILLNWNYQSSSADHFEIESSNDGEHFSFSGTVKNGSANNYSFTDMHPFLNENFYRIRIVFKNGDHAYSNIISLKKNESAFKITASPLPFKSDLKISFYCDDDQQMQLSLVDILGRAVVSQKINCVAGKNDCELHDLSSLNKALYFIKLKSSDRLFIKKVLHD